MRGQTLALVLVGALAVAGVVYVVTRKDGVLVTKKARVLNRERAAGVDARLLELLDAWEREGEHDVLVAPDGGVRKDAARQAQLAAGGASNASTLAQTPHGRGGALDVWPVEFEQYVRGSWDAVPRAVKAKFEVFGGFAEARGFTWGGRWRGATFPNGDQPHVEVKNWRQLPYPPSSGGVA